MCVCVSVSARARVLGKYEMNTPTAHLKKGTLRPHYYILLIGGHSRFDIFQQCDCNVFMGLNMSREKTSFVATNTCLSQQGHKDIVHTGR